MTTTQHSWEARFDEEFPPKDFFGQTAVFQDIKQFFKETLATREKELVGRIEAMIKERESVLRQTVVQRDPEQKRLHTIALNAVKETLEDLLQPVEDQTVNWSEIKGPQQRT